MLFQKRRQVAFIEVRQIAEFQVQQIIIWPITFDPWFMAEIGDLPRGKPSFRSDKVQINGIEFFGLHRSPLFLAGQDERHDLFIGPNDFRIGSGGRKQIDQFFQQAFFPENFLSNGKTSVGKMPLAAELFPRLQDVGVFLDPFGELPEAGDCPIDEVPKLGPVDFLVVVDSQFDFLPRTAQIFALYAMLCAVEWQFRHIIKRF